MIPALSNAHQSTFDAIFAHPSSHNLPWRDIRSLLSSLGTLTEQGNGQLKATAHGQSILLHPNKDPHLSDTAEINSLRHYLTNVQTELSAPATAGTHLLVVIDHREARIYKSELAGTLPTRITPFDPHGFGRALHYTQDENNGQRKPELKSFYEAVTKTLEGAGSILIIGNATGEASAMTSLLEHIKQHHHQLLPQITGHITLDTTHMSEDQLLAASRAWYANPTKRATPIPA